MREGAHGGATEAIVKGPHGGRLLRDDELGIEVTIFERGVPPEFRVYAYEGDDPLEPTEVKLGITLRRFGNRADTFRFVKCEDFLLGDAIVEEPHSFDVEVVVEHRGRTSRWTYPSYEGRTEMSPAALAGSEIAIETVGPAAIRATVQANGRVVPNEDRLAHVIPRFPGVVKEIRKRLGDAVTRGEVLAVVESNESLQAYEVKASIAGTIIAKEVTTGELAPEGKVMFTIADLGTVWADLNVSQRDFQSLRLGQHAIVEAGYGVAKSEGPIIYLSPFGAETTQTLLARVELSNVEGQWKPGLFVSGEVLVAESQVATAVKASALQTFRDWDVVFLNEGNVFQAIPVELGRRDAEWVEIVGGVASGQRYAAENSFVVKADIGRSGATHDH
jgi:cobalt-zinc-cadmium efflux system membrane fusion protein